MTKVEKEHKFPKYDLDADFWRNRWCEASAEALQQQLEYIKLEKKLATAVEALKRITEIPDQEEYFDCEECISMMEEAAKEALVEIGGEQDD